MAEWGARVSTGELIVELSSGSFEGPGSGWFTGAMVKRLAALRGDLSCNRELVDSESTTFHEKGYPDGRDIRPRYSLDRLIRDSPCGLLHECRQRYSGGWR